MTYVINISGHKPGLTTDEAQMLEYGVARHAHELVKKLEGVTHASFGSSHYGHVDLLTEPVPPRMPHEPNRYEPSDVHSQT